MGGYLGKLAGGLVLVGGEKGIFISVAIRFNSLTSARDSSPQPFETKRRTCGFKGISRRWTEKT